MIDADIIARAKSIGIQDECRRRGIELKGKGKVHKHSSCPVCGGTDRYGVDLKQQLFYCRNCGVGGSVIDLVMHADRCSFGKAIETLTGDEVRKQAITSTQTEQAGDYEREQHRKAAWLWSQRKPIKGTPAETYLRRRGIDCTLPPTLAFLPPSKPNHHPALIAAFALVDEPEPGLLGSPRNVESVHLTLLQPDGGGKADVEQPKLIVGSPGSLPIALAPINDLLGLATTEGIEDALTVHLALGMGAWAAGSAGRMPKLAAVVPSYIEAMTIFAHADEPGQDGARKLATTLRQHKIEVVLEGLS